MASLADLSWHELVDYLETARSGRGDAANAKGVGLLVHDLLFHQLELEMQNRELRDAQSRLEASHARYEELYDQAPVGYVSLDARGCIVEINLTGAALLGREREAIIGAPFVGAAGIHSPDAFFAHLQRTFRCKRGGISTWRRSGAWARERCR